MSATRRATTLEARLEKLVHEFIYRPHPPGLDYREWRDICTATENTALFNLLGRLEALVLPYMRLTRTQLADAVTGALNHALTQEHARFVELGVTLAPDGEDAADDDDPPAPALVVHSLTGTGLCASDCAACA